MPVAAFNCSLGAPITGALARARRRGQTVVELLLILPIFVLMMFFIMEIGNIAFQTILVHHCAYELARIGSLVAGPNQGSSRVASSNISLARGKMYAALKQMFPAGGTQLGVKTEATGVDPQVTVGAHLNEDIVVSLTYNAKLVFPGPNVILASSGMRGRKRITATVRMPIEKPVFD
ncbi:MAG: TadE family protein [Elusimicrobiales bacterium]